MSNDLFDLPEGWSWQPLSALAEIVSGGTPSREVAEYWSPAEIAWVTPTDITGSDGRHLTSSKERISKTGLQKSSAAMLPVGTVLMTSRATLGQAKISAFECCTNQGFKSLVPKTGVPSEYLYYLVQLFKTRYEQLGIGSTFLEVSKKDTEKFMLPVAPEGQRTSIAKILGCVDNQIDATQALIDKYTAIKQGMMADLFSRGIEPDTKALRPTFEEAPELYHKTPLGMLPKGWDVKTLREYTTLLEQGWSPDCESEPAFEGEWGVLKTSAVVWEGYLPGENKRLPRKLKPKDKYEVYPGDVLITRAGPGSRVGVVAFVNTTPKRLMLSDKLYRLRFDSRLDGMFASYLLSCELVQSQLNKVKTGLAESQANISQEIVMSLRIAVPNADEQKAITDKVRSAENYLNLEREHLDKLLAQKAGLMQDLLTGKVPV